MDISLNWLEEWIDLSGIEVDELAHRLTMAGLEVDAVESVGDADGDIVVGRITEIEPHPDADRLVLCRVDVGDGSLRRIACGATNMEEGDLVPTALPGSHPPGIDFAVESRELMGVTSEGMLCSAEELDLAESSEGLMILPENLEVGISVFEALDVADTVFSLDLTPNRSDCLSHFGVAREVSALYDRPLEVPDFAGDEPLWAHDDDGPSALEVADLDVESLDYEGCPRYLFAILEDVEVGPSPLWLRKRLQSIGLRSVNNVVDVTNFILMDVGQPLHAFDLDELDGPSITVRRAKEGETLEAIDHETYELDEEDLVVADASKPVALAGVIGSAETEVTESTSRVLLECAFFNPRTVRRASKRHGIHTDSSHRFERRIDPIALERFLNRTLHTIVQTQRALPGADEPTIRSNIAATNDRSGYDEHWHIDLPVELPERVLGTEIEIGEIRSMLERLHLYPDEDVEAGELPVQIPSFRGDLRRPIDLVEEIARLHGYDQFDDELPTREMGREHVPREEAEQEPTILDRRTRTLLDGMRRSLLDAGLHEVVNDSFMSDRDLDRLRIPAESSLRETVEIANPVRSSDQYMQTTVLPSLLTNLVDNRAQQTENVAIFEVARRYFPDGEEPVLGLLLSGSVSDHWSDDRTWDVFDLEGLVELIGDPFELDGVRWREPEESAPWMHPGVEAEWSSDGDVLAHVGRLHPEIARDLDIDRPVLLGEVAPGDLLERAERDPQFQSFSNHPPVERDVALLVDDDLSYRDVRSSIEAFRGENASFDALAESIELFDIYEGEQVPEGKRSMAFSVVYRADDRSLTEEEIDPLDEGLETWLRDRLGAERR